MQFITDYSFRKMRYQLLFRSEKCNFEPIIDLYYAETENRRYPA